MEVNDITKDQVSLLDDEEIVSDTPQLAVLPSRLARVKWMPDVGLLLRGVGPMPHFAVLARSRGSIGKHVHLEA